LGRSVQSRYFELLGEPEKAPFPEDGYKGDYTYDLARGIIEAEGDRFLKVRPEESLPAFITRSAREILKWIKKDLDDFRVHFDVWYSERALYEKNLVKLLNLIKKGEGEGVGRHEAPRGEDVHYVKLVEGSENLAAWKIRAPTYNNLLPWVPMFKDAEVADIPIIVASTDPCMSCLNRVTVVHPSGRKEILTHEELHRLSVEKTRRMRRR